MLQNYLTVALRNIANHKLYSFINIAGLAVALACAILIMLFVRDDLSYDKGVPGQEDLYRVQVTFNAPGRPPLSLASSMYPLGDAMKNEIGGVVEAMRLSIQRSAVKVGDRSFFEPIAVVDPNFFTMLGGKDYNQTLIDRVENADPRYNVDSRVLADRWKKAGDKALFKNIADLNTSELSDRFIQKDNELTLQSVYLSYDLVPASAARLGMRTCRLAFTMNDVFHWSTMKIERGIDYPYARSFTFSVQTSF